MTELDILHRVIHPEIGGWGEDAANAILSFSFSETDLDRMHSLLEMSKWDKLDEGTRAELVSYQKAAHVLGLMKSRARVSLNQINGERPIE